MKSCEGFAFWLQWHGVAAPTGECRRYPPGGPQRPVFTDPEYWCGEFEQRTSPDYMDRSR